jgi:hypothetical protein
VGTRRAVALTTALASNGAAAAPACVYCSVSTTIHHQRSATPRDGCTLASSEPLHRSPSHLPIEGTLWCRSGAARTVVRLRRAGKFSSTECHVHCFESGSTADCLCCCCCLCKDCNRGAIPARRRGQALPGIATHIGRARAAGCQETWRVFCFEHDLNIEQMAALGLGERGARVGLRALRGVVEALAVNEDQR